MNNLPPHVADKIMPVTESGCWIWVGATNQRGYGVAALGHSRRQVAHRVVYEMIRGAVPAGLVLDHKCRVTFCCNPDHLEPVTQRMNVLRGTGVISQNAAKTHCVNGHPLSGGNLCLRARHGYVQRECKACKRQRMNNWRLRQRAAAIRALAAKE